MALVPMMAGSAGTRARRFRLVVRTLLMAALAAAVGGPFASSASAAGPCVSGGVQVSPLDCSAVRVAYPYRLSFGADAGGVRDAHAVGTGFTMIDPSTKGGGYLASRVAVDTAAGTLGVTATPGTTYAGNNSQDDALGVGVDAANHVSQLTTTLVNVPAGTGQSEQGGLWFGLGQDDYAKLVVLSTPQGPAIQFLLELAGAPAQVLQTAPQSIGSQPLKLSLTADPAASSLRASYALGGNARVSLGKFSLPSTFFNADAAGIDPAIGTRVFGGILTSQRSGPGPLTYAFADFALTDAGGASGPPPDAFPFTRVSFPLPTPTAMAFGPDGRLYVSELMGVLHALTLGSDHRPQADQVIGSLPPGETLGLTVDPASTPSNVILWVSHSSPSLNQGTPNSGTVTRLSGPGFSLAQDVITGLPRALANHATNGLHFGPDGRLYIAQGGNTGAGAANTASTEFGTRSEQPLSAAILVADVHAPDFHGACATPLDTYGPAPCDVQTYATGLRNAYDLVWHSNGNLYAPDNGLGVVGTYPPTPNDPCTGLGNPTPWSSGGDDPGTQPDVLDRILPGGYYGHPNPYRHQCVFGDGHYQGVAPLPAYIPPMYTIGDHYSADGIIEYHGPAFAGALDGNLLIANYSQPNNVLRLQLTADGSAVSSAQPLAGGFTDPLALTEGPDGSIYVADITAATITALTPSASSSSTPGGSWTTRAPLPMPLLDATATALNGRLYVLAGKTPAGHQRSLQIYDPTSDTWTSGPDLPAAYPSVENPALVAANDQLYAFGGSTGPFSGATTSAAVYDPTTTTWHMLPPMPHARAGSAAALLDGQIYLAGGMDAHGASLASMDSFDPTTTTWHPAPAMTTPRDNPGAAALDGKLYVFGGRTRNANGTTPNDVLASVEAYDPTTHTWTSRTPMPTARRSMAVGTLQGHAQLIGGERTPTGATYPQNEDYDPTTNTWHTLAPMPTPRHGTATATIADRIYIAGGGPRGGTSYTAINEAFQAPNPPPPPTPTTTPPPAPATGSEAPAAPPATTPTPLNATTPSSPAAADTTPPRMRILSTALSVLRGAIWIRLQCPSVEPLGCTGHLALRAGARRRLLVASSSFRMARPGSAGIRMRLTPRGLKLLRRVRLVTTRASLLAHDRTGNAGTTTRTLKLKGLRRVPPSPKSTAKKR